MSVQDVSSTDVCPARVFGWAKREAVSTLDILLPKSCPSCCLEQSCLDRFSNPRLLLKLGT